MSSFDKLSKMYEKMKEEKPGFNAPVQINQPEPSVHGDQVISEIDREPSVPTKSMERSNKEYDDQLRRKIIEAARAKGKNIDDIPSTYQPPSKPIQQETRRNLEKRVEYLEEAVKLLMTQQMELMKR